MVEGKVAVRFGRQIADVAALLLLLGAGWRFWPGPAGVRPPGDLLLFGPDAAAWAQNALHLEAGDLDQLDFHRMPTYTLLIAAGIRAGMGAPEAGHLVNHLSMLLLPPIIYALGALGGSRAAGLGAGLMLAVNPYLLTNSRAYGVDPLLTTILPLMMLAACVTARRWWFGVVSGVIAALAAAAHFTTLAHLIPPAILILLAGRGWWRLAGLGLHVGASYATIRALFSVFPFPDRNQFMLTVQEGAAAGTTTGMADADWSHLRSMMEENGSRAVDDAIRTMIQATRPEWLPWQAALALPWIGVVGLMLAGPALSGAGGGAEGARGASAASAAGEGGAGGRWPRVRLGAGIGVPLLLCLGPLPFLAMAEAPERYSYNLIPFVVLLQWRGAASALSLIDGVVGGIVGGFVAPAARAGARWAEVVYGGSAWIARAGASLAGVIGVVGALWAAQATEAAVRDLLRPLPPPIDAQAARQIGEAIARHFPPGGGVAVPLREAAIYAEREYCPRTGCPFGDADLDYRRCIFLMERECGGEGGMAYVVLTSPQGEGRSAGRIRLDDWVAARWEPLEQVRAFGYQADVYEIPREEARGLVTDLRFLLPQPGSPSTPVPPPPGVTPPPVDPGAAAPSGTPGAANYVSGEAVPALPGAPGGDPYAAGAHGSAGKPPLGPDGRPLPGPIPPPRGERAPQ